MAIVWAQLDGLVAGNAATCGPGKCLDLNVFLFLQAEQELLGGSKMKGGVCDLYWGKFSIGHVHFWMFVHDIVRHLDTLRILALSHTNMHACIRSYIRTYLHTYAHTYVHTFIQSCNYIHVRHVGSCIRAGTMLHLHLAKWFLRDRTWTALHPRHLNGRWKALQSTHVSEVIVLFLSNIRVGIGASENTLNI